MSTDIGKFYNELSVECGVIDDNETKNFYHGLIKMIKRKMKTGGYIELPGFAHVALYSHKGRRYMNVNTMEEDFLKPHKAVKIKLNKTFRKEIRDFYNEV